ncbi:MAG: hypothetical protein ACFB10_14575 [Salibacteraceae bacterium]
MLRWMLLAALSLLLGCGAPQESNNMPAAGPTIAPAPSPAELFAYRVGNPVLYFTSPLEMKLDNVPLSDAARQTVEEAKMLTYTSADSSLSVSVHYMNYGSQIQANITQASVGAMMALQNRPGAENFEMETYPEERQNYGKDHKYFSGTFVEGSDTVAVIHHSFAEGSKLWQMEFLYNQEEPEQVQAVIHTLRSMRFEAPTP